MSGGHKPLPPLIGKKNDGTKDAESKSAMLQLNVLVEFMAKEFLNMTPTDVTNLLENFGVPTNSVRIREVYDCLIDSINGTTNVKRGRWQLEKMGNIFNVYADITPEDRSYQAPAGVAIFERTGEFMDDGSTRCRKVPRLTPRPRSVPRSPTDEAPFPPTEVTADDRGHISPTSPPPYPAGVMPWPMSGAPKLTADASVVPPHLRNTPASSSGEGERRWGKGKGKTTPEVPSAEPNTLYSRPIQRDAPIIQLNLLQKQVGRPREGTTYSGTRPNEAWTSEDLYSASHLLTTYLRHGDRHGFALLYDDGYVDVNIIVQMPQFMQYKPYPIDKRCIELILMLWDSRIESDPHNDPPNTRIRAIQGHTIQELRIDRLYTNVTTLEQFNNFAMWNGNTPDHAIVELRNEEELNRWCRTAIHPPTRLERWHTLKATIGTGRKDLKVKTMLYAFIEIKALFTNRISIYMTNGGRLVIPQNLPYGLVKMVRNIRGEEVSLERRTVQPPIGPPQVRDARLSPLAENYRPGGNTGGRGLPTEGFTETKDGKLLTTHYHKAIIDYCMGSALNQENELQMCRGRYKMVDCTRQENCHKNRTGECPFRHSDDDDVAIDRRIREVRKRIFTQMDRNGYDLNPEVLLEIGRIDQETYDAKMRSRWEHEQMVADNKGKGKGGKGARSRSPARSSSRTPSPNLKGTGKGKPTGKSADPTPAEAIAETTANTPATADSIEDIDRRQRDHASGQDDQSDTEPIAPLPADDIATDGQANDNDSKGNGDHDDELVDFGSPADEVKMETEEHTEQGEVDESATPAASSEYHMVTEANVVQNTILDVS